MEAERRLSQRKKRKPLADCTNTLSVRRNIPPSIAKLQTLNPKPPKKPSNITPIVNNNSKNGNLNENSFVKSHTSTGSNNSPISDCVLSQPPAPLTPVSDPGGRDRRISGTPAAQIQKQDEKAVKDKGKMVEDTPLIQASVMLKSQPIQMSSSAASGHGCYVSGPPAADNRTLNAQTMKDKGKKVVETPIIHVSVPVTHHPQQTSSSAASGNERFSETPAPDNCTVDAQLRKDKGKKIVETPIIHISAPVTYHAGQTSSLAASGNCYIPGPSVVQSQKPDARTRTDKGKIVQKTPDFEASDPKTPCALTVSSYAASGTDDQERPGLVVYNQRKAPQRKNHAGGSITMPLSCPPDKRIKKKGVVLDGGGGDSHSGSHTDPLPLHKKKRSRNKHGGSMHAMPQNEVEQLRAYYADIDAFELPEEVASESELE